MSTVGNCSLLASRTDLASYIQEVNVTTGFNDTLLQECKSNICNALWGTGNADISGIGLVLGYFLASIIGLSFALAFAFHEPFVKNPITKRGRFLAMGLDRFFDCMVFFAASIQIACVVVLIRKDFGINANGLGGLTVQITWTVAILCMLPLLYPMAILEFTENEEEETEDTRKSGYRLFLFCGCWLLFVYTYLSQMIGEYGPSQVGIGAGPGNSTIVDNPEYEQLTELCLSGTQNLSGVEQKVLNGFSAAGASAITAFGLVLLLWFIRTKISEKRVFDGRAPMRKFNLDFLGTEETRRKLVLGLLISVLIILTVPQFWGILRLRNIQKALADNTGNVYVDNQWTFGQVVAVVLFVPVFTDMGYEWRKEQRKKQRKIVLGEVGIHITRASTV